MKFPDFIFPAFLQPYLPPIMTLDSGLTWARCGNDGDQSNCQIRLIVLSCIISLSADVDQASSIKGREAEVRGVLTLGNRQPKTSHFRATRRHKAAAHSVDPSR